MRARVYRYRVPWRDKKVTLKDIKVEVEMGFDRVEKKNLPWKMPFLFVRTVLTVAQPREVFFWIFTRPAFPHGDHRHAAPPL